MTLSRTLENRSVRLFLVFLMIFAMALTVARPAHAVVGVTSIFIPSVIAALESWGISTAADGLDGDQIAEWFYEKLTSWETAAGIALENIAVGIKMTPLGQVLLNPVALTGIREFGAWLVQQEGLVAGGSSVGVVSPSLSFNGFPVATSGSVVFNNGVSKYVFTCYGCYLWSVPNGSGLRFYAISSASGGTVLQELRSASNGNLLSSSTIHVDSRQNGLYYKLVAGLGSGYRDADPAPINVTLDQMTGGSGGAVSSAGSLDLVPSAEMDVPTAADVQDKELLLNTSLDVGADAAAWYDSVMQKVAANDLTVTGTITQAGTITADQVIDQGAIREEDGVVVWPDVVQPIGVTGLEDIFPFCIPFDIYHFCQALAAEPVAPSFDVPFRIEGIVDYTFHLDLEDFDQVAALLRTLELLLFCVGLAFVTRSMFIRG